MADIFISYRSAQTGMAGAIAAGLENAGYTVWWAGKLVGGANFQKEIRNQLWAAQCVVVVWSQAALDSDWVLAEATDGHDRGVLVPVMTEVVRLPPPFNLTQTTDLSAWKGEATDPTWGNLLTAIGRLATPSSQPSQTASFGHFVHKLRAKDSTGRWAYYFIYVPPSREKDFLASIGGPGIIDLQSFGVIVASNYGEEPDAEVRRYLKTRYGFEV